MMAIELSLEGTALAEIDDVSVMPATPFWFLHFAVAGAKMLQCIPRNTSRS